MIRRATPILALFFVMLIAASTSHAKEWRGLVPLHSTREDVEKLLGKPPEPPGDGTMIYTLGDARSIYFTDEGRVYIGYANDVVLEPRHCLDLIPTDTVLGIQVTFRNPKPLSELQIDEARFLTYDPSQPANIGFKAYVDDDDGFAICTKDGKATDVTYYGTPKDYQVCPALRSDPKDFCRILVDFFQTDEFESKDKPKKKRP